MKKQSLFLFGLFLCFAVTGRAQITTVYSQGFESGEAVNYTVVQGNAATQSSVAAGGTQSLKMSHGTTSVTIMLDTINLTNGAWQHFTLEFMHINNVSSSTCNRPSLVGVLEVKRPGVDNDWTKVSNNYYNVTEGSYSVDFFDRGSFCSAAYDAWNVTSVNNSLWRHERFDFDAFLSSQAAVNRKLLVRFTLMARTASGSTTAGWYLDDITLKVSADAMITPLLSMVDMPDALMYPSSRGARIAADISTTAAQGMDPDSIYVIYRVGSDPTQHRLNMTAVASVPDRYETRIPFYGYDTMMYWHLVSRDATSNRNTATYPASSSAWRSYKCVRGASNCQNLVSNVGSLAGSNNYPLPAYGDNRSEFVVDSATLRQAGYRAGAITSLVFTTQQNVTTQQVRERFQIRMANVPTSYASSTNGYFYSDFMKAVYDDVLTIDAGTTSNSPIGFALQDTFFYSGQDILIRVTYDNSTSDPAATSIRVMPVSISTKNTVYVGGNPANLGSDFFDEASYDPDNMYITTGTTLPHVLLTAQANLPLVYDCGVASLAYPNDLNASHSNVNDSVVVWLKNYGANTIQSVPICYSLDNGAPVCYTWNGSLAAGDSVRVRVTNVQQYTVGFHSIKAWVGDTVTANNRQFRDHEPYNDTASTDFIACAGAMSGVRQVGGTNADYATLDNFLFSLSRCGVDGPLTVKLAAGTYAAMSLPLVPGISSANTVTFEPLNGTVKFVADATTTTLVDLSGVAYFRFHNIGFERPASATATQYLVRLSASSSDCRFENCWFTDNGTTPVAALIATSGADSLLVDRCQLEQGTIGIDLTGSGPDNHSSGSIVTHNEFANQSTNALKVLYQDNLLVDSNWMNNVLSNSSYVLVLQGCSGNVRVTSNKLYTSHGASALGLAQMYGTAQQPIIVANNMVVCDDDGQAMQMSTPVNFISGQHTLMAYNSVSMKAPARRNQAAFSLGSGSGALSNVRVVNNLMACMDGVNMAFSYDSRSAVSTVVNHNVYYSSGGILNKYINTICTSLADWMNLLPSDSNSRFVEPTFLNGGLVDLRAYDAGIRGCGMPLTEITTDMFGTARDSEAPCAGALEFEALYYDFSIEAMVSPEPVYCVAPATLPLRVLLKNIGVQDYNPASSGTLTLHYRCGTQTGSVAVNCVVPAGDTATFFSSAMLQVPSGSQNDTTHEILLWLASTIDPNATNDTLATRTQIRYTPAPPTVPAQSVTYASTATLNVTSGLVTWPTAIYRSGRTRRSQVYWYLDSLATTPFHQGESLTTAPLYDDTAFYVEQRREMGLMKITEVQISNTAAGVTDPYPSWFGSSTKLAIELTNVGDYPVDLANDTVQVISASYTKTFVLPAITVQPAATMVIQIGTGTSTDSAHTLYYSFGSTAVPGGTTSFAVLYRDGSGLADVAAFNSITSQTAWNNQSVPAYLWSGSGVALSSSTAGATRTSWPTNPSATPSNTRNYWTPATADAPMTLGTTDENLIIYEASDCAGARAKVPVTVTGRPSVDIAIENPVVGEGCGLFDESLSVTLHNYGVQASSAFTIHYSDGTHLGTDVVSGLAAGASVNHVFTQPLNMHAESDTTFHLVFWVENYAGDVMRVNDTATIDVNALYTPTLPNITSPQTCVYGQTVTLAPQNYSPSRQTFRWYDSEYNELGSGNNYTTPELYLPDTFYVSGVALSSITSQVGTATTTNTATSQSNPSPYQVVRKYAREQYLYTVSDLQNAGLQAGPISSIAFYLDTLLGTDASITFSDYTISIGTTTLNVFASSGNNWQTTVPYYSSNNFTIHRSDSRSWITHVLDSTFMWDGVSNIVVQVCRAVPAAHTTGLRTTYTSSSNRVIYTSNNNTSVCAVTTAGTRSGYRPNIRFGQFEMQCEGHKRQVVVTLTNVPDHEASLSWTDGLDTMTYTSCAAVSLSAKVLNLGGQALTNYNLTYRVDNGSWQTVASTGSIAPATSRTIPFSIPSLSPGRHHITAVVHASGDVVATNDTASMSIRVRFCAGDYTVGGATGNYADVVEAIDTLNQAGVVGAVRFLVTPGTYNGQVLFGSIEGASATNTVTLRSSTGVASDVILTAAPTNSLNYVVKISDNASNLHFENLTMYSQATGNYNNVVLINNASDVHFVGSTLRVKGTTDNTNASCLVMNSGVRGLYLSNCVLDSGYYSVRSTSVSSGSSSLLRIEDCQLTGFRYRGVDIDGVYNVGINGNTIRTGVNVASRPLTGINIVNSIGALSIMKNNIVLSDNRTGGKLGIKLKSCQGASLVADKIQLHNNMVSLLSASNVTEVTTGIWIDGTENVPSKYMEIYYNTVRVYTSDNRNSTFAFKTEANTSDLYIMNNIFSNFSTGFAYHVAPGADVVVSDYNDYYSTSATRLAFWGSEQTTLAALQTQNGDDANSVNLQPFFVAEDNLHMTTSNLSGRGLYNAEIPDDIDGTTRPQIPLPTIGAHEYPMPAHDISVAEIVHPVATDNLVEGDVIMIVSRFYNNGSSTETNVSWYAEVLNVPGAVSNTEHIATIASQNMVTDTTYITMPNGVIDSQTVRVYLTLAGDMTPENNEASSRFYLAPAYNISATTVSVSAGSPAAGCNLQNAVVTVTLKNVGRKPITTAMPLTIGYQVLLQNEGLNIPNLPIWHEETVNLPTNLAVNATQQVSFTTTANLYPTGYDTTITTKIRAWVNYEFDLVPTGDTTNYIFKQSHYTPQAPVGVDLHIPYATTDVLWASQTNEWPIRWYRDSTSIPFYSPTTYANSTHWNNAPRFFNDTVFYLNCKATGTNCVSPFSEIHVYMNPRVASDVAAIEILAPNSGQVYVERDTVRVRIANYSNRPMTNIPVVYRFSVREGSNFTFISQVREVYTGTIPVDGTVNYAFDTLVEIPANYFNTARTYRIEAWTDLDDEMVRSNDTVGTRYTFQTLAENTYCTPSVTNSDGMDITRLAMNNIDWEMPAVGRGYLNLATFSNPGTGKIILPAHMHDTLIVSCANSADRNEQTSRARFDVYVDYNRNGIFDSTELVLDSMLTANRTVRVPFNLPDSARSGYMKARFILNQDTSDVTRPCVSVAHGNIIDWLLFVEKDLPTVDLAPARIVTGHDHFVDANTQSISFVMVNKGSTTVNSAEIHYTLTNRFDGTTTRSVYTWNGSLASGMSAYVTVPNITFNPGTTDMTLVVSAAGDTRHENDTLTHEFHRFHVRMLTARDNFDAEDYWYAPEGSNEYCHNYWERGEPLKTYINTVHSEPNVWTTGLTQSVATGKRGTVSILYSPIYDVSQIQSDSLSFMLSKKFAEGSYMYVEFLDITNKWTKLTVNDSTVWYDSEDGFTGNTQHYGYVKYAMATSSIVGDFSPTLQFRFIYYTPATASASSQFSDGCAIDNFVLHRAQRAIDVGVLEITAPTQLTMGSTVSLTVTLINYGFDTVRSVPVAYRPYGSFLAREELFSGVIAPNGGTASFTFSPNSAFTVTSAYPEMFEICAFTRSTSDLYRDNDTACYTYILDPLECDIEMRSFLYPGERAMAGDSVGVTVRFRNNGYRALTELPMSLMVNEIELTDTLDFVALMGRPLASMEYFNYTFSRRYPVSLGSLVMTAYCSDPTDGYHQNDTITTRVTGIHSLTDLCAKEMVIQNNRVQLTVENLGSRVASGFTVGYYYNNDPNTTVTQTFDGSIIALTRGYVVFNTQLPATASHSQIKAFVHIDNDANVHNDTTSTIVDPYVDIQVNRIQVEENINENCLVRMKVQNVGNTIHQGSFSISAVINGTPISTSLSQSIAPGPEYPLAFTVTIPKSPTRSYVGTGLFTSQADANPDNNQTTLIDVLNSFEGVPTVECDEDYVLEQNYPNPFNQVTTVSFTIPKAARVRLFVIDAMGHLCYQRQQLCEAGRNTIHVDVSDGRLSSGIYFYGIECDDHRLMRKMIVR